MILVLIKINVTEPHRKQNKSSRVLKKVDINNDRKETADLNDGILGQTEWTDETHV
jgi:hypothetical protein